MRRLIEELSALTYQDADIGDGMLIREMRIVLRRPIEISP